MFETYITIHQDAYADLEQYGEVISEEKHVRDLLTNIKDNSPAANAAKGTILATPALRTNFSNAVAHHLQRYNLASPRIQEIYQLPVPLKVAVVVVVVEKVEEAEAVDVAEGKEEEMSI
jgi:hypothetical protein